MTKQRKTRRQKPATVPFGATPSGEPPSPRQWAKRLVWTDRMLTTLETGVRGGKWHTLIDKVYGKYNLYYATQQVVGNKGAAGVDHQSAEEFYQHRYQELPRLQTALEDGSYCPQPVRRVWIDKPGTKEKRPLGVPTVRDRVAQTAVLNVIEPIFDATFHEHSYGFRHGRGCHHALERVEQLLEQGNVYVVDADLKSYFDTIPKAGLMARVQEKLSDSRVLRLIEMFLEQGVMDGLREWTPETGTPQGAVISPLLANIYLNPLDHMVAEAGFAMVRYADDFVILCPTRESAEQALALVTRWVQDNGLTLHPTKTKIVHANSKGFDFLGYRFRGRYRAPRDKSLKKFSDTVRAKTKRNNGNSLPDICQSLSFHLRGWFNYFRHCTWTTYRDLDQWIRGRLRSILRRRKRRRGRSRWIDHQLWPNTYFDDIGLFSLSLAHVRFVQSSMR